MINWYLKYDSETVDLEFDLIDYSNYNPMSEKDTFSSHYFQEIIEDFQKFECGNEQITLSNDQYCSKCQAHLIKQSNVLMSIFKTETILCDLRNVRNLSKKAVHYLEAERFYYYCFWNAVSNDKSYLIQRLHNSFKRFLNF